MKTIFYPFLFLIISSIIGCQNNSNEIGSQIQSTNSTLSIIHDAIEPTAESETIISTTIAFITANGTVFSAIQKPDGKLVQVQKAIVGANPFSATYAIAAYNGYAYIVNPLANQIGYCQINGAKLYYCTLFSSQNQINAIQSITFNTNKAILSTTNGVYSCPLNLNHSIDLNEDDCRLKNVSNPAQNLGYYYAIGNINNSYLFYTSSNGNIYTCLYTSAECNDTSGYNQELGGNANDIKFYNDSDKSNTAYITTSNNKLITCIVKAGGFLACNYNGVSGANPVNNGQALSIAVKNSYVYFTNNSPTGNAVYYCPIINYEGNLTNCMPTAYSNSRENIILNNSYGITFYDVKLSAFISSDNSPNGYFQCYVKKNLSLTSCTLNTSDKIKSAIGIDLYKSWVYIVDEQSGIVWAVDKNNPTNYIAANPVQNFTGSHGFFTNQESQTAYYFYNPLFIRINKRDGIAYITAGGYIYSCIIDGNSGIFSSCSYSGYFNYNTGLFQAHHYGGSYGVAIYKPTESKIGGVLFATRAAHDNPFDPNTSIGLCPNLEATGQIAPLNTGNCTGMTGIGSIAYSGAYGLANYKNMYFLGNGETFISLNNSLSNPTSTTITPGGSQGNATLAGLNVLESYLYVTAPGPGNTPNVFMCDINLLINQPSGGTNPCSLALSEIIGYAEDIAFDEQNVQYNTPESQALSFVYVTDGTPNVLDCSTYSGSNYTIRQCIKAILYANPLSSTNNVI